MNRLFLNLIGCFSIACYSINVCGYLLAAKANNYEGRKNNQISKSKKVSEVKPPKGLVLVPPPPPDQPSLLDLSPMAGMGEITSFLNETELKSRLEHIQTQINDARLKVKENDDRLAGNKERVEQFTSLYAEGVISRKELDATKKDAVDQDHLAEEAKNNLADLEIEQTALVRRLNILKRNGKQHQTRSSKKNKKG